MVEELMSKQVYVRLSVSETTFPCQGSILLCNQELRVLTITLEFLDS